MARRVIAEALMLAIMASISVRRARKLDRVCIFGWVVSGAERKDMKIEAACSGQQRIMTQT
jgi:hypothetical protein